MIFRKALSSEINEIWNIYESVKQIGKLKGNSDWDEDYPNREILTDDMNNGNVYVLVDDLKIVSAVSLILSEQIDISPLKWNNNNACFLGRLCVVPEMQNKGIAEITMKEITKKAKELHFEATHHLAAVLNPAANKLYKRMGYHNLGKVHLYETDFFVYEMIIK